VIVIAGGPQQAVHAGSDDSQPPCGAFLFKFWDHSHIFAIDESRHFKFNVHIDIDEYSSARDRPPQRGCVQGHVTSGESTPLRTLAQFPPRQRSPSGDESPPAESRGRAPVGSGP